MDEINFVEKQLSIQQNVDEDDMGAVMAEGVDWEERSRSGREGTETSPS